MLIQLLTIIGLSPKIMPLLIATILMQNAI
jgi:hypothetical protein